MHLRRKTSHLLILLVAAFVLQPAWGQQGPDTRSSRPAPGTTSQEIHPDPLPLRRILIAPELVPAELERLRKGALVKLTRQEFEEKLQRARQAGTTQPEVPRLIEARYRASLLEGALIGTAEWRAVNPSDGPCILPVQPFNLALRKAHMQKGEADNTEALLGDLNGKGLGLLLEQPGELLASLDWAARGVPFPGGLRFDLRIPTAAVSTLELTLPADVSLEPHDQYLVTGPFPAETPQRRLWRVDGGGQSQLMLVLQRVEKPAQTPVLILAQLESRQELEPQVVRADFDFSVEVLHRGLRELVFACDPELSPYEVNSPLLQAWEHLPAPQPGQRSLLKVHLREAQHDRRFPVQIRCLAPLRSRPRWTSPSVRLNGAVARGETLTLRVHPELRLEDWNAGAFQIAPAAAMPSSATTVASSGTDTWQVISLVHTALVSGNPRARPSARLALQTPEFRCRQITWWSFGSRTSSLTTEITYELTRGELFRLPVAIPLGWEIDKVELTPASLLRSWSTSQEHDQVVLNVELQHPATAGTSPHLSIKFQSTSSPVTDRPLPFPDPTPRGPWLRQGVFAITVDPLLEGTATTSAVPHTAAERGPWGEVLPHYVYSYRGLPMSGTLQVRARQHRCRARCRSDVMIAPDRSALTVQLTLQAPLGASSAVDLLISGSSAINWQWKTEHGSNEVRSFQRLPAAELALLIGTIGVPGPLTLPALFAAQWKQEIWRMTLAQPLREPLILRGTATFQQSSYDRMGRGENLWEIPLPVVLGAEPMDGEIRLELGGVEDAQIRAMGLAEMPATPDQAGPIPWRTFRYERMPASLSMLGSIMERGRGLLSNGPRAAGPLLTALVGPARILCRFVCDVRDWSQRTLPLRLPNTARVVAVAVDGCWVAHGEQTALPEGQTLLTVPFPAGNRSSRLQVLYELPITSGNVWTHYGAPAPELPIPVPALRRRWLLPPGTVPLFPVSLHGATDSEARSTVGQAMNLPTQASSKMEAASFAANMGLPFTEWEPIAGTDQDASLLAIRQNAVTSAAIALATLWLLLHLRIRMWSRPVRKFVLIIWLGCSGLGALWLPHALAPLAWYSALAGVGALCFFASGWRPRPTPTAAGTAMVTAALSLAAWGLAEGPAVYNVYFLARNNQGMEAASVLAPAELMERLEEMARRGPLGHLPVVLLGADYEGQAHGARVDFRVRYRVHSFVTETATLTIPLGGVQLQAARCDGADSNPVAVRQPHEGYSLPIQGAGHHEIMLEFSVPVQQHGAQCEVHCTIPELVQTHLRLSVPAGSRTLFAQAVRGAQRVTPALGPHALADRPLDLEADLGAIGSLIVRWRHEGSEPQPASLQAREAYLWELHPSYSDLRAVVQYTVAKGAVDSLLIDLPEPLQVRQIEAARLPGMAADEPPPRVRSWHITGQLAQRRLHIELHRPVSTGVQLNLELVARSPFGMSARLPVPSPQDVDSKLAYLAYRAENVRATPRQHLRLNSDGDDSFAEFWKAAGLEDAGADVLAYSFARNAGLPLLELQLENSGRGIDCLEVDTWKVGARQADLTAVATLTAEQRTLLLIEWTLPPSLAGLEVTGADVQTWSRTGSRLQVWLRRPCEHTEITVAGWQPLAPSTPSPTFQLPAVAVRSAATQRHFVGILAADGVSLEPERNRNLLQLPDSRTTHQDLQFITTGPSYAGTFMIRPGRAAIHALRGAGKSQAPSIDEQRSTSPAIARADRIHVLLGDHSAFVQGGRWRHTVSYRILQEASVDLDITLPEGALLQAAAVDGKDVPVVLNTPRLWLPLPGPSGVRTVNLEWEFDAEREPYESPNFSRPRLNRAVERISLYTLRVPLGYKIAAEPAHSPFASAAQLDLERSSIQTELGGRLAQHDQYPHRPNPSEQPGREPGQLGVGTPVHWIADADAPSPAIRLASLRSIALHRTIAQSIVLVGALTVFAFSGLLLRFCKSISGLVR